MVMHERCGNQQLDADKKKEQRSSVLSGVFSQRESVRGNDEGESRTEEQKYSHT